MKRGIEVMNYLSNVIAVHYSVLNWTLDASLEMEPSMDLMAYTILACLTIGRLRGIHHRYVGRLNLNLLFLIGLLHGGIHTIDLQILLATYTKELSDLC